MAPGALLNKLSAKGFLTKGHYKLVSGLHSNTYINVRLALMDPDIRRDFTQGVLALCPDFTPDCVAAFTIGGVHLGESVAEELGVPFIVGRTGDSAIEWKDVEYMNGCKSLLLVDDILTTAEQLDGGLSELEKTAVQTLQVIVAVDRSGGSATLRFRGNEMKPLSVETVNGLKTYSPTDCPDCNLGIPYTDLSDPENDFSAILLYGDPSLWERAVAGFEKVYGLQGNEQKRNDIVTAYGRLSASVRDALPTSRIREDNGLINFIGRVENLARRCGVRRAVAAEVVGQLMSLSAIRVENRGIGCSLLVGDHEKVLSYLGWAAPIELDEGLRVRDFLNLVPHFDGLQESRFVFVLDKDGTVVGLRRLYPPPTISLEGTKLLGWLTHKTKATGFVLRRGRSSLAVYSDAKLEGVAELSERTGCWHFSRPMERLDYIDKLLPHLSPILPSALELCRELTRRGQGGLLILGSTDTLEHDPPKIRLTPRNIEDYPIEELAELAKLDGATLIDTDGTVRCVTVIVTNEEKSDRGTATAHIHGGSRRVAARRTSLECPDCAAIYVSQNGDVVVWVRGEPHLIAEPIATFSAGNE